MGFFKAVRQLNKQANEIQQHWDVGAQLEQAQASMAQAQQFMAEQTAAASLAAKGVDATATITGVRQGAGMVNFQPVVELDLTVSRDGLPPYPATAQQVVPQIHLSRAQPGQTVRVKVDAADATSVWIDWDAAA